MITQKLKKGDLTLFCDDSRARNFYSLKQEELAERTGFSYELLVKSRGTRCPVFDVDHYAIKLECSIKDLSLHH
jgi:hypothetical protein